MYEKVMWPFIGVNFMNLEGATFNVVLCVSIGTNMIFGAYYYLFNTFLRKGDSYLWCCQVIHYWTRKIDEAWMLIC